MDQSINLFQVILELHHVTLETNCAISYYNLLFPKSAQPSCTTQVILLHKQVSKKKTKTQKPKKPLSDSVYLWIVELDFTSASHQGIRHRLNMFLMMPMHCDGMTKPWRWTFQQWLHCWLFNIITGSVPSLSMRTVRSSVHMCGSCHFKPSESWQGQHWTHGPANFWGCNWRPYRTG